MKYFILWFLMLGSPWEAHETFKTLEECQTEASRWRRAIGSDFKAVCLPEGIHPRRGAL